MTLFDPPAERHTRPKRHDEPAYAYMNTSAWKGIVACRVLLEEWFQRFPADAQTDVRERFRSSDDAQHQSAFFELYMHELMRGIGYDLEAHPQMPNGETRHPDFLVRKGQERIFYLECIVPSISPDKAGKQAMIDRVYATIDRIDSPNFFLSVETSGVPAKSPPAAKVGRALERWLRTLDPDQVAELFKSGGFDALPAFPWEFDGWEVVFQPIPKSPEARGRAGVRPIGMQMPAEATALQDHVPVKNAVIAKASRYGEMELPYLIAINAHGEQGFMEMDDFMAGLLGQENVTFFTQGDRPTDYREGRNPDGAWNGPKGWQCTRVSGVIAALGINPFNLATVTPELIHHPAANCPLTPDLWPLPQWVLPSTRDRLDRIDGRPIRDFLRFPDPWPIRDK